MIDASDRGFAVPQAAHVRWLREQLPRLVAGGILDAATAERLAAHFGAEDRGRGRTLVMALFGTLGALFIGGGIILLVAHNWDELGRPARTALSLLPLLLGIGFAVWVVTREHGEAWREAAGALWTLSIGAAISLVAQTYHLPGDLPAFLRIWLLLALPVLYLLEAATAGLLYLLGTVAWVYAANSGDHPLLFWALLAAGVPFLARRCVRRPEGAGTEMLVWAFALAVVCGGIEPAFQRLEPLWGSVAVTISLGLLAGGIVAAPRQWGRPLRLVGGLSTLALMYVLSYAAQWRLHPQEAVRLDGLGIAEVAVLAALGLVTLGLFVVARRRRGPDVLAVAAALPLVWVAWLLTLGGNADAAAATVNGYLLLLGVGLLVQGMREDRLRRANVGTAMVGLLILLRFFDADWGFLVRGSAFLAVGVAFLLVNTVLLRRRSEA
jgi:uncharacterized membrane protein